MILLKQFFVDTRTIIKTFKKTKTDDAAEIVVTGFVFSQQNQVPAATIYYILFSLSIIRFHVFVLEQTSAPGAICLAANNRFEWYICFCGSLKFR